MMRLRSLELFGYKTFAARTKFQFDGGITAVVGPNGSGKSNVADAVRWVLGEQSFSLLRARKGEDMIFSGSERRPRMGMAEATITLDNSDHWLDIDFGEVAVTRRSYRSGENEYLLNGSRVRLRDILDLLAKSGLSRRTYTVVSQGLVGAALSLRPQERRTLIEEAAGLASYRSRRSDALNKLEETQRNVLRVRDLIAEISPRLARLERQAERAREHALVRQQLEETQRIWYSYQWKRGQDELRRARVVSRYQLERLKVQREQVKALDDQIAALRARHAELRAQLGAWHRDSSALHARSETHQRDLAVAEERRRLLTQSRDRLLSEVALLEGNRGAQAVQVAKVESELADLATVLDRQAIAVETAREAVEARQREAAALRSAQAAMSKKLLTLHAQTADHDSRLARLAERKSELQTEAESHEIASGALEAEIHTLGERIAAFEARLRTVDRSIRGVEEQRSERESRLAIVREREQELREQVHEVDRLRGRLQERHELLTRMHTEGAGLYDGVRSVFHAARGVRPVDRTLQGIVGTVAELLQVSREFEVAIEVALGAQLQDLVVESWADAQRAIDHLKRTRGGRATFLPLDTLQPPQAITPPPSEGVIGLASDRVTCAPRLQPVVDYLLGRTILCQDLEAARRLLQVLKGNYRIVTPAGEVVRSSGAVTGGTGEGRSGGMLARERERRELPSQLEDLQRQRQELIDAVKAASVESESLQQQISALTERVQDLEQARRGAEQEYARVRQEGQRIERERDWHRSLAAESAAQLAEMGDREAELGQRLDALRNHVASVETEAAKVGSRIDRTEDQELNERLAERRAESALTRQRQATKAAELEGYRRSLREVEQRIVSRRSQVEEISAQSAETERHIEQLRAQEAALSVEIQTYADLIDPAEADLEDVERQQAEREAQESSARTRLQAIEARYNRSELDVTRQEEHMNSLSRQIEDDLGPVDLDMGEDLSGQPYLPLTPLVSSLPQVDVLPEGIQDQMNALKRHLRRLEPVNPTAPEEHAQARQRHGFLSSQAHDLDQAMAQLKEVIGELDTLMEREFKRTFAAISREFRAYFDQLFRGGSARLELTEPDDLMNTGIEIVVRPPGKRQQGLDLLSGGERALTTAALIFAILSVSPTPFCVLDEVDATLDEANVGRFRAVLKNLSEDTQFVIITHNRYTIEVADVVYGISMGVDGTSCVISHRLNHRGDPERK